MSANRACVTSDSTGNDVHVKNMAPLGAPPTINLAENRPDGLPVMVEYKLVATVLHILFDEEEGDDGQRPGGQRLYKTDGTTLRSGHYTSNICGGRVSKLPWLIDDEEVTQCGSCDIATADRVPGPYNSANRPTLEIAMYVRVDKPGLAGPVAEEVNFMVLILKFVYLVRTI